MIYSPFIFLLHFCISFKCAFLSLLSNMNGGNEMMKAFPNISFLILPSTAKLQNKTLILKRLD